MRVYTVQTVSALIAGAAPLTSQQRRGRLPLSMPIVWRARLLKPYYLEEIIIWKKEVKRAIN